jgi:import receptor subunit TOM70
MWASSFVDQREETRVQDVQIISSCTGAHRILPENLSTGDETLSLGLQALDAADYIHAVTLINEAIEQGVSWDAGRAEALNLRGTSKCVTFFFINSISIFIVALFRFLMGEVAGAKADLEESVKIVPEFTQSLMKIASVHMEQGNPKAAFECFKKATKVDSKNPDIYYHCGQGSLFFFFYSFCCF